VKGGTPGEAGGGLRGSLLAELMLAELMVNIFFIPALHGEYDVLNLLPGELSFTLYALQLALSFTGSTVFVRNRAWTIPQDCETLGAYDSVTVFHRKYPSFLSGLHTGHIE